MAGGAYDDAGRRRRLTRSDIVDGALELARDEGIGVLTMRRLAEHLRTAPMSLYRHVADRQDLLLGMLDVVAAGLAALPPPDDDPATELTTIMTAAHRTFLHDPWVVEVLVRDGLASPLILPVVNRVMVALERGGLRGPRVAAGYALLWHYLYGECFAQRYDRPDTFARQMTKDAAGRYPAIDRVAATLAGRVDRDFFAENLTRLISALLDGDGDDARANHGHRGPDPG